MKQVDQSDKMVEVSNHSRNSMCQGKLISKKCGQFLFLCLCVLMAFSSCQRGISIDEIAAMEKGAARDSAICYYKFGFYLNQPLQAADTFAIDKEPEASKNLSSKVTVGDKTYVGDILVNKGDTLIPVAFNVIQGQESEYWSIQLHVIRNGEVAAKGWNVFGPLFIKDVIPFAWTSIFHDWDAWVLSLILFGGFLVLCHRLWLWIYRKIQRRRDRQDITKCGLIFHFVFVGVSFLIAAMCVYFAFNPAALCSMYYNPDIFGHWSEYSLLVKFFPLLLLLFVVTAVAMFLEMMRKMASGWFVIHFIGWFALGCLTIGLTLLASWLLYLIIVSVLPFVIFGLVSNNPFGKAAMKGGNSSGGSMDFRDEHGGKHLSGVDRDRANQNIQDRK